jgi:Flp pilus assembly protein TadG
MAMIAPMLIALLFGSMELGHYFWNEHVLIKSVRDGARYAARQGMANYFTTASGCVTTPPSALESKIKNLVRTGSIGDGGGSKLSYWTDPDTIEITVACSATSGGQDMTGIYNGMTYAGAAVGAPVVTITATVPYETLFGMEFGSGYSLPASQQAAVTGV